MSDEVTEPVQLMVWRMDIEHLQTLRGVSRQLSSERAARDTLSRMVRILACCALLLSALAAPSQTFASHQVNADGSITFRYNNRGATKVELSIDAFSKRLPMTRNEAGVWSVTTPVLPPEFYGYSFVADGVTLLDPRNGSVRPSLTFGLSVVEVPGATPQPWDVAAIPHGRVDHHVYTTHIAKNLPANQNAYFVYTPPGYDAQRKGGYPVLYLLHGWSDDESGWTAVGYATNILDTLIHAGSAVPMIVVMPLGYGDFDFVTHDFGVWNDQVKINSNVALFTDTLESELMPAIEAEYNVAKGRDNRAIAGLSMGGLESLSVGLNHSEQFAYVGGMSSAVFGGHFDSILKPTTLEALKKNPLRLLWVACGTGDRLYPANQQFIALAKEKGLEVTPVSTAGAHTWLVWRDNLVHLAPLLFRK